MNKYCELLNMIRCASSVDDVCHFEKVVFVAFIQHEISKGEYIDLIGECRGVKQFLQSKHADDLIVSQNYSS